MAKRNVTSITQIVPPVNDQTPEMIEPKGGLIKRGFGAAAAAKRKQFQEDGLFSIPPAGTRERLNIYEVNVREKTFDMQGTSQVLDIKGTTVDGKIKIRSFPDFLPMSETLANIMDASGADLTMLDDEQTEFKERTWSPLKTIVTMEFMWAMKGGKVRIVSATKVQEE